MTVLNRYSAITGAIPVHASRFFERAYRRRNAL
jgi:hypothetical protein